MIKPAQITLKSSVLHATILPRGAALVGLRFIGQDRNLVIGFADIANHANIPICAGTLVGPVANRVRHGRVMLSKRAYQMPQNEGQNTLHSGPDGLHSQLWKVTDHTENSVTLRCSLADGANGLPGNRTIHATYRLVETTLTISLSATTDHATPMNIAAHPYWNLDGQPDVSDHQLSVHAEQFLPTDANGLPTGELCPVKNSGLDFTALRRVPLSAALDVNFCLTSTPTTTPRHAATLVGNDGTQLAIATTAPGLQVYAGSGLPDLTVDMADCSPLKPYSGIALEPQHWPDAPHHGHFPQITLLPGQTYSQITHYTVTAP